VGRDKTGKIRTETLINHRSVCITHSVKVCCLLNRSMQGVLETTMRNTPEDPIRNYQRNSVAKRRKAEQSCKCGENRPQALITICAECLRKLEGKSVFDAHHPAGRANHPLTINVPANDHRAVLSDAQYDWPPDTLKNPRRTPTLAGAASIRGYCDADGYFEALCLITPARLLEALDEFLLERLGPNWWVGTKLEEFAPKRASTKCLRHPRR
jgi:hypothetical protein